MDLEEQTPGPIEPGRAPAELHIAEPLMLLNPCEWGQEDEDSDYRVFDQLNMASGLPPRDTQPHSLVV